MRENERKRIRPLAALVDEMDAGIFHLGPKVMELVEGLLTLAPVELGMPVGDELLQIINIGASVPAYALHLIGPARVFQTHLQVAQHFLGDVDREGNDFMVLYDCSLSVFQLGEFLCQGVPREGNLSNNTEDSIA